MARTFFLFACCWAVFANLVLAQQRPPLSPQEAAILDNASRNELDCRSDHRRPRMDFHFRFSGFLEIAVGADPIGFERRSDGSQPARQNLKILARLVPQDTNQAPSYLRRNISIQAEAIQRGKVRLGFRYFAGAGRYRLDWMAEADSGKVCAGSRRLRARPGRGQREIRPSLAPGQTYFAGQASPTPWWYSERQPDGFELKLILNIPPFKEGRPLTQPDLSRIEAILTALTFHPRVREISLVIFNIKDQRVLYRQEQQEGYPDRGELAEAIRSLSNNKIRLEALEEDSEIQFMKNLLIKELSSTREFDAVVLIGPRSPLNLEVSDFLDEIEGVAPLYYLKYRFFEAGAGWSDPLQRMTNKLGGQMFPIQDPKDLWKSVQELIDEIEARR